MKIQVGAVLAGIAAVAFAWHAALAADFAPVTATAPVALPPPTAIAAVAPATLTQPDVGGALSWAGPGVGVYVGGCNGCHNNIGTLTYIQAGYFFNPGHLFFGAEVEGGRATNSISSNATGWVGNANARVGFTLGRVLAYAEVGFGIYQDHVAAALPPFWSYGGGIEFAISPNISIVGEAKFLRLIGRPAGVPCNAGGPEPCRGHVISLGVYYRP